MDVIATSTRWGRIICNKLYGPIHIHACSEKDMALRNETGCGCNICELGNMQWCSGCNGRHIATNSLNEIVLSVPLAHSGIQLLDREYNGFANPHRLWVWVGTGTGAGWQIAILEKPALVTWVWWVCDCIWLTHAATSVMISKPALMAHGSDYLYQPSWFCQKLCVTICVLTNLGQLSLRECLIFRK